MQLRCNFYKDFYSYVCKVQCVLASEEGGVTVEGVHDAEKCDDNVEVLVFHNIVMESLPSGLSKVFPNLEELLVYNCRLS